MKMASIAYVLFLCLTLAASTNDQRGSVNKLEHEQHSCVSSYNENPLHLGKCVPIKLTKANDVDKLVKNHIANSYHYLFLSSYFGNYEKNRVGFQKLFKKLSDSHWEDAVEIIKYAAKRGHEVNINFDKFEEIPEQKNLMTGGVQELPSLVVALDLHLGLTKSLHGIVKEHANTDVDMKNYLEDHYMEKHTNSIRELSGHIHDLKKFLNGGLSVFLFDEYLQSVY